MLHSPFRKKELVLQPSKAAQRVLALGRLSEPQHHTMQAINTNQHYQGEALPAYEQQAQGAAGVPGQHMAYCKGVRERLKTYSV